MVENVTKICQKMKEKQKLVDCEKMSLYNYKKVL